MSDGRNRRSTGTGWAVWSGTPRHRILTGRICARTRDRQMNFFFAKTAKGDADITPASPVGTRTAERISAPGVRGKNIPPADTPPHSSPSTPRRPRLSRTRFGGRLPFGLWRRLSEGDGQRPERGQPRRTSSSRSPTPRTRSAPSRSTWASRSSSRRPNHARANCAIPTRSATTRGSGCA